MQITGKNLQVTGKDLLWMQHLAKNVLHRNANARVNPLLEQVLNVMAQHGNTEATNAVSSEMQSKLQQLEKESSVDKADEGSLKGLKQVSAQLASVDQEMYNALFNARIDLRDLVDKHDGYANILDGTVNYDQAMKEGYIDYNDREKFQFTDFETYLVEKGYQGDATKAIDFLNTEWTTAENSMGMTVTMLPGQVLVKGENGTLDKVIYEDQLPLYEQWQEEKKAFEAATLKEYAAEKLPQVQRRIEDFPKRINQIVMSFALKKAAIIEKLPKDAIKDEYLENMKAISESANEINSVKTGNGKELLNLLNRMMDRQGENTKSLGGVANSGGGVERIKNGRLPWDYYA